MLKESKDMSDSVQKPGPDTASPPPPAGAQTTAKRIRFKPANMQAPPQLQSLNTAYIKSIPGILKLVETVLAAVAYCCAIASRPSSYASWSHHILFSATIIPFLFFLIYVAFPHASLGNESNKNGLIFLELIYYFFGTILIIVTGILMAVLASIWHVYTATPAFCSFLCFVLAIVFAVDFVLSFLSWRRTTPVVHVHPTSTNDVHNGHNPV